MAAEVKRFDDLDAVERDAGGALGREAQPSLFERIDWFRLVERHSPPPGRTLVLRARDEADQAWLFLSFDRGKAKALANWYSLEFGIVGDKRLAGALVGSLHFHGIPEIDLYPVTAGDGLERAFKANGWLTRVTQASVNWRMTTQGLDFEAYWAARPSRLRNTADRKARSAGLEIEILDRFDDSAWAQYEEVYKASWKPTEGSSGLLRALAIAEGAAGTLRLGLARQQGRPVAAQLWLVERDVATIHKLAYDEKARAHSPGTVLGMAMFRHALDVDRVAVIDFGLGDDGFKADWIDQSRPVMRLAAWDLRSLRGFAAVSRAAASKLVRSRRSG